MRAVGEAERGHSKKCGQGKEIVSKHHYNEPSLHPGDLSPFIMDVEEKNGGPAIVTSHYTGLGVPSSFPVDCS